MRALLLVGLALAATVGFAAVSADAPDAKAALAQVGKAATNPEGTLADPEGTVQSILNPPAAPGQEPGRDPVDPGFAEGIRNAFRDQMVVAGLATLLAAGLGVTGFAMVTRYVRPEEALANPQRSMLYGFIRGNPGVHLKRLSEEFGMKTSSILWHIRKLENAELVRSDRANGFRVFYPTAGGTEMKVVSRATTALQNANARHVFEAVEAKPGAHPNQIAQLTGVHAGTVRWHLRKLREFGLLQEMDEPSGSTYYPTPLGVKAAKTLRGVPGGAQLPVAKPTT